MTMPSKHAAAYDFFHIAIHGTQMLVLNENTRTAEIRLPFNACHDYVAACLDEGGAIIHAIDLNRAVYSLTPALTSANSLEITPPDPDRLLVRFPGAHGPSGWCKIVGLPWPDQLSGWRHFPKNMLNSTSQTYQDNGLDSVDLNKGVPMVYVLQFGPQADQLILKSQIGDSLSIEPRGGVGRLHIYAEGRDDTNHDAISTLNACANPPFDINVKRFTPDDMPALEPPPDRTLAYNEQLSLSEQTHKYGKPLTKLAGQPLPCCEMASMGNATFGHPRTCTPVVALANTPQSNARIDQNYDRVS